MRWSTSFRHPLPAFGMGILLVATLGRHGLEFALLLAPMVAGASALWSG